MNDFVDECRREWRRLCVPDRVADEMADELAADLADAEKDGIPAEDVLGSATSDPRSLAASRAAARGAVGSRSARKRALVSSALAGLAAVAVSGAILLIVAANPSSGTRQAFGPPAAQGTVAVWIAAPTGKNATIGLRRLVAGPDTGDSNHGTRTTGLVLLIVSIAGILPLTFVSLSRL